MKMGQMVEEKVEEKSNTKEDWNQQWEKLDNSLFGKICSLHRKQFISKFVAHLADKYFTKSGVFVEAGCGTGESSMRIKKYDRKLIPLDISEYILKIPLPKNFSEPVVADIRKMPFADNSVDGIWNLGVLEHFTEEDVVEILNEFHRVLKDGAYAVLFIPPVFGSSELVLGAVESVINLFKKEKFQFMTDELTPVKSKRQIASLVNRSNLEFKRAHFSIRDLFTYYVVVCKKTKSTLN